MENYSHLFENKKFDLILCLDVLEHLIDPWSVIKKLIYENLREGGTLIACIPNVRYYNVLLPLLLKKEWKYQETGVLDRTHLRFFTKKTILELISSAGLQLDTILSNPVDLSIKKMFKFTIFRDVS